MPNLDLGTNEFTFAGDRTQINYLTRSPGRYESEKKAMGVWYIKGSRETINSPGRASNCKKVPSEP
jgi:hypothetical protein